MKQSKLREALSFLEDDGIRLLQVMMIYKLTEKNLLPEEKRVARDLALELTMGYPLEIDERKGEEALNADY